MEHANPYGPQQIVGQLQFVFDEIPPLTLEEQLSSWLSSKDQETPDALTALLFMADNDSRRRRAKRWSEIRQIQAPYDTAWGWLVHGGPEASWLYDEACRGYINGCYFSALLCSHAACERALAGLLDSYREELDKGWLMWGLGKLINAAKERKIIDDNTLDDLRKLTEIRKVSSHYKPFPGTTVSVHNRANEIFERNPESDYDEVIDDIVRQDALFALGIATAMVRGNFGFGGGRFLPPS